jgi:hypothetical protein
LGAGRVDDVDGNDNGRHGGLQLEDNGIGVRADANVVVIVVDEDHKGRKRRHVAWIEQRQLLH